MTTRDARHGPGPQRHHHQLLRQHHHGHRPCRQAQEVHLRRLRESDAGGRTRRSGQSDRADQLHLRHAEPPADRLDERRGADPQLQLQPVRSGHLGQQPGERHGNVRVQQRRHAGLENRRQKPDHAVPVRCVQARDPHLPGRQLRLRKALLLRRLPERSGRTHHRTPGGHGMGATGRAAVHLADALLAPRLQLHHLRGGDELQAGGLL